MTINDPQAVAFANESMRPISEKARAFVAEVQSIVTRWNSGINVLFPNDSTALNDGRDAEGISRLVGSDVNSVMNIIIAMASASNSEIIEKPCVRTLQAS